MTNKTDAKFGFWTLVFVVIASMIGSGVFTTSGFSIASLGSPSLVLLAWLIGGLIAVCGALSYGMLARLMPQSGGEYLYLSRTIHPAVGFLAGWISFTAGFTGAIALAALTCEEYLVPSRPDWLPKGMVALVIVCTSGIGHSWFVRATTYTQNAVVLLKLCALIFFLGISVFVSRNHVWHWESTGDVPADSLTLMSRLATAVMWISLSYAGFNAAIYVGSEVHDASRVIPRALVTGTLIVTVLYLMLNVVFLTATPASEISLQPPVAAIAAKAVGGPALETLIRSTIAVATFTSVIGMIMTGPRVYAQMAADGVFPSVFSTINGRMYRAVILQSVLAACVVTGISIWSDLKELLNYMGTTLSLSSAVAVSTLIPFGFGPMHHGGISRSHQRIVRLTAILYVGATLTAMILMIIEDPRNLLGAACTILGGIMLWFVVLFVRRKRS